MNNTEKKSKKMEKLDVRDFITIAVLLILNLLIFTFVGTPIGFLPQTSLFIFAVCAIPWGVIYMLLLTKVNKKWVILIYGGIHAILNIMNFWFDSVIYFTGILVAEIIWQKCDRKRFVVMMTCFTITVIGMFFATVLTLLLLREQFFAWLPATIADLYAEVYEYYLGPFFIFSLLATIGGCIAGAFLGKAVLKKHFEKAGIV
jgi:energy-coupling factor transport system substrate-specific component